VQPPRQTRHDRIASILELSRIVRIDSIIDQSLDTIDVSNLEPLALITGQLAISHGLIDARIIALDGEGVCLVNVDGSHSTFSHALPSRTAGVPPALMARVATIRPPPLRTSDPNG
jgi:hypothetical protein